MVATLQKIEKSIKTSHTLGVSGPQWQFKPRPTYSHPWSQRSYVSKLPDRSWKQWFLSSTHPPFQSKAKFQQSIQSKPKLGYFPKQNLRLPPIYSPSFTTGKWSPLTLGSYHNSQGLCPRTEISAPHPQFCPHQGLTPSCRGDEISSRQRWYQTSSTETNHNCWAFSCSTQTTRLFHLWLPPACCDIWLKSDQRQFTITHWKGCCLLLRLFVIVPFLIMFSYIYSVVAHSEPIWQRAINSIDRQTDRQTIDRFQHWG